MAVKKKETRGRKPKTKSEIKADALEKQATEMILRPAVRKALGQGEAKGSALPAQVDVGEYKNIFRWFEMGMTTPQNDKEWAERITTFFAICAENDELITWEKFCLAVGYTTLGMSQILSGRIKTTPIVYSLLQKAKQFVSSYDATLVSKGKLNPVAYIFRGKQYYGFKTDSMLEKELPVGRSDFDQDGFAYDPDSLADKYLNSIPVDDSDD